jgi:DNA-directed RNA polymerase subunit N (RpoN/RPB10)
MKGRRVAIPSSSREDYITKGKRYDVLNEDENTFSIIDDVGQQLYCCLKVDCSHLGENGSWKLLTERK